MVETVTFEDVEDYYAVMIRKVKKEPANYSNWRVEENPKLFKKVREALKRS